MDEHDRKMKATVFFVEANHFETMTLWQLQSIEGYRMGFRTFTETKSREMDEHRVSWVHDAAGFWTNVGVLAKMPVAVSIQWYIIDGHRVGFYDPQSQVVDYRKIRSWLDPYLKSIREKHGVCGDSNSSNFSHCMTAIRKIQGRE